MSRLTEEMVIARAKQSDLGLIKKLNCWGSDLSDVNIIKRMISVEVLALSVNKISTLAPFQDCTQLQELYLRKNNIENISEICYLQRLPALKNLWLEDNPCCEREGSNYRAKVLRALPNLEKLDNVEVTPEELENAVRNTGSQATEEDVYEDAYEVRQQQQQQPQHQRTSPQQIQHPQPQQQQSYPQHSPQQQHHPLPPLAQPMRRSSSPFKEEYYQSDRPASYPAHYRHSQTDLTAWEEHQQHHAPQVHHNPYGSQMQLCYAPRRSAGPETGTERYAYRNGSARENGIELEVDERPRPRRAEGRYSDSASNVSTTVMNHFAGYHRRPVNRNSNLLSATLCLVKELDYGSLEVLEHAVRCRIDEMGGE